MTRQRNEILVDIVNANGGTVRNPNVRNMLLEDWLSAIGGSGAFFGGILQCSGVLGCNEIIPCGV